MPRSSKEPETYAKALATEKWPGSPRGGSATLVVVNTVGRAQALYEALSEAVRVKDGLLLIHSRFRPATAVL